MKRTLNIRLNIDEEFLPKAKYIFDLLLNVLGLKAKFYTKDTLDEIHIYYGVKTNETFPLKIYRQITTSLEFHKKNVYDRQNINFYNYKSDFVPFLYSPTGPIFLPVSSGIILTKDIISSAFYLVTDWEEYIGVSENEKLAVTENFSYLPLLEIYADILKTAIMQTILKQIIIIKPKENLFYSMILILNKLKSPNQEKPEQKFIELQKLEHYRRKFLGSRRRNHISVISNEESYLKIFKSVYRDKNKYEICNLEKKENFKDKVFLYNLPEKSQTLFNHLQESGVKKAICNYFQSALGYKNLYSSSFKPFDFKNNKTYDFTIIPIVMVSSFVVKNCDSYTKILKFQIEKFFNLSQKYNANIFIGFDVLDFYYHCNRKFALFYKIRKCLRKLKKTYYKPMNLEIMDKVDDII